MSGASVGRIRSFSEDRKPGSWLPEDQWAVRPPCTTCPDPCAPKKPAKPSRSWLSICKDPEEPPLPCDIRHNNCPPPPPQPKEEPWYAFIKKKKPAEKPKPPLNACRMELQRMAEDPVEDYCEDMTDNTWPGECPSGEPEPEEPVCPERPPAPIARLSCPPPKDLDLMLWCGKPGLSVSRIASQCQSDRMPYEEFRPRKCWKPPPFSLPRKCDSPPAQPFCCNVGRQPFAEFKQVDIPKPLYTRYKSVELEDENFFLCMTDPKCPPEEQSTSLAMQPPPVEKPKPPPEKPKLESPEKPVLVAASKKPVRLKCAPKFQFRPKPTKLIERRTYRNPCAQHSTCNLKKDDPPAQDKAPSSDCTNPCENSDAKVITGTLTDEPPMLHPNTPSVKPPHWMYMLSKPGSKDTPLVPHVEYKPVEPDWSGETDGLKFYDGQDEGIHPKPPPDPCSKRVANAPSLQPSQPCTPPVAEKKPEAPLPQEKFVLMPERFNIRNMRPPEDTSSKSMKEASFQEFIDAKTSNIRSCSKLYPQMKENILYDLVRNCPLPPFDPTKADPPPRKPPPPECPQPMRFYYRRYSTLAPTHLRKPNYAKVLNRMMSEDSREKCKVRRLVPKAKDCPPPKKGASCNEMELPCCPKANIPPRCDIKRPMPPCKKRLAPKPSYSECSKDPPPCPRITECNAWEKRELENQKKNQKGRKFSNWAIQQGEHVEGAAFEKDGAGLALDRAGDSSAPGPHYSDYSDLKDRGQSLNKSKWSPHKQRKVFSGKELMLNFVNPAEDTENSYYKSDSLVRRRKPQWRKLKTGQQQQPEKKKIDEAAVGNQLHERKVITALLQDQHTRNGKVRAKNLSVNDREVSALALHDATDDSSKFGSFGSWINSLIKAQRNRSKSCPPPVGKLSQLPSYVTTADVNRIMVLTKPFRDKLRSHSVGSLTYFAPGSDVGFHNLKKTMSPFRRMWGRNRNRSLTVFPRFNRERVRSSMLKYETLSPSLDFSRGVKLNQARSMGSSSARTGRPNGCDHMLWMDRRDFTSGLNLREREEYSIPKSKSPTERKLLQNIYRSAQSGPDASKWRNSIKRNAQVACGPEGSEVGPIAKAPTNPARKKSVAKFSVVSRGSSTFARAATARRWKAMTQYKSSGTSASSAELVAKKVSLSRSAKTKRKSIPLESPKPSKARFMQSATSSLVTSAMEKREAENLKLAIRGHGDGRPTLFAGAEKATLPLALPQKSWIYIDRGCDANMKQDFKKTIAHATIIKSKPKKWLQDVDDFSQDYLYEGKKGKKKVNLSPLKDDLKYCADKYLKRQEVKNMLSKLELKKNVMRVAESPVRVRQKEQSKKDIINMLEHTCCSHCDRSAGRFEWQHALFRNNLRSNKGIIEIDDPIEESNLSGMKSLIDMRVPAVDAKCVSRSLSEGDMPKKLTNNVELYDVDLNVVECINVDDKPSNLTVDNLKKQSTKKKSETGKSKWSKIQKDCRMKEDKFTGGSFTYEKMSALSLDNRDVKQISAAMPRPRMATSKSLQAVIHTRRHSNKPDGTKKPKRGDEKCNSSKTERRDGCKTCGGSDCNCQNKNTCEVEEDSKKQVEKPGDSCRWNTVTMPGPNCPDS